MPGLAGDRSAPGGPDHEEEGSLVDRSFRRSALAAAALSAALVAVSAFGAAAQDAGTAKVRVLHASPDAPAVDVYADGAAVLTNVAYGVISGYLEVPAGDHHIQEIGRAHV